LLEHAWGYEIHATDRGLRFVDRRTWGVAYAAANLGGMALVLIVGTFVVLGTSQHLDAATAVPALLGLAVALLAAGGLLYRVYRHRRDRADGEMTATLVVDAAEGVLKDRNGQTLARLADVRVTVRRELWWTHGVGQTVSLAWPGGKSIVFRTARRARIASILQILADAGL
jgi:hypothetical protein